jgi:hypothetical protein
MLARGRYWLPHLPTPCPPTNPTTRGGTSHGPNEALTTIRDQIASFLRDGDDVDCTAALEAMHALDGWLARGGFLPDAWRTDRHGLLTGNDYLASERGQQPDLTVHALP